MLFLKQFLIFLSLIIIISFINCIYTGAGTIGIDDGNIFLNYAQHIARGQGFVFNTNGERVEGFTSLLWVLICAGGYIITGHPELLLICFSCLLTALTVTIIYREIKKDIQKLHPQFTTYFFWIYCCFIISIGPAYFTWSVLSLMENALWNFIFTCLVILIAQTIQPDHISLPKKIAIILLGCLLAITRPESLAWNLVFTVILMWTFVQNKRRIYFPLIYFICVACIEVGLTMFRLHYFGFQFPNTYYAKISPDRLYNFIEGSKYALSFLTGYQPVISSLFMLMSVMLLYGLIRLKLLRRTGIESDADSIIIRKLCIITLIILVGFALPFTTGGDHFGGFRFYQDLLLLFAFGIVVIVWLIKYYKLNKPDTKIIFSATAVLFVFAIGFNDLIDLKNPVKTQLNYEFILAKEGRDLAAELNNAFSENKPSAGMIAVGGFGLIYQGTTVDMMGLNNILMGHSEGDRKGIKNHAAFNKDVFYILNPGILLPENADDFKLASIQYANLLDINNFDNEAMKNIFNDDAFQKTYPPVFIFDKKNNAGFFAFVNISYMNTLRNNVNLSVQKIYAPGDEINSN
ncbi:MAG: hypothetical protein ABI405_14145 [Parafilimonas sp.]